MSDDIEQIRKEAANAQKKNNVQMLKDLEQLHIDETATSSTATRFMTMDDGTPYFKDQATGRGNKLDKLDSQWVSRAFLVPGAKLTNSNGGSDKRLRFYTTANMKWTTTALGGNIGFNSRPGFTPYADPPARNLVSKEACSVNSKNTSNLGLGRFYSEAIDDSSQTIYMRFGVPQYSSILRYFSTAFDYNALCLVRTGEVSITNFTAGTIATGIAFWHFPLLMIGLLALKHIAKVVNFSSSRFYTFKSTMHIYWNSVSRLVNIVAVNKGIIPRWPNEASNVQKMGTPWKFEASDFDKLGNLLDDGVFNGTNGFDVWAMANRAQRRAMFWQEKLREAIASDGAQEWMGLINKLGEDNDPATVNDANLGSIWAPGGRVKRTWWQKLQEGGDVIKKMFIPGNSIDSAADANDPSIWSDRESFEQKYFGEAAKDGDESNSKSDSRLDGFWEYLSAEIEDGEAWVSFKVDYTGAASDSFNNSVAPSSMLGMVNNVSNTVRDFKFGMNAVLESVPFLSSLSGMINDSISGTLGQWTFGMTNLIYGMGVGFIDVPKFWSESSYSPAGSSVNYTMQLISPYGNVYSQMQNQVIPLCMIMAAGLPRSTGSQSHGSPFICQVYDRGRLQIRTGMVTSLTVTRGTTNLGFNKLGCPLGLEVQFKVEDLSTNMSVPMATGSTFSNAVSYFTANGLGTNPFMDEDNPLNDYLSVLAGVDLYTQLYPSEKAKLRFAQTYITGWNELTSPAAWASWTHDTMTSGALGLIGHGIKAWFPGSKNIPGGTG